MSGGTGPGAVSQGQMYLSASLTMQRCHHLETFPDYTPIKKQSYIRSGPRQRRVLTCQQVRISSRPNCHGRSAAFRSARSGALPGLAQLIASWPPWTTSNQDPAIYTWGYKARPKPPEYDSNFKNRRSGSCMPRRVWLQRHALRVDPLVNFQRIATGFSQMMERHRSGVDLIQIGRIREALSLLNEILDPRTSM
jgi:hypothetical protein